MKRKLKPGDIVKRERNIGMIMRNDERETLVAYPGNDELTIEQENKLKYKGNIKRKTK